jgi:anti-sigma regulatory factor (Ser/Thr protein kinase)
MVPWIGLISGGMMQMISTVTAGQGAAASGREIKLDPDPASVRRARDFVRRSLRELGFPGRVDDGVLIVSELVTNALRAAPQTPCVVVVRLGAGRPVIEVHDGSSESPKRQDPDFLGERGRGLHVIDALCEGWDCVPSNDGKAVIAVLRR